MKWLAAFLTVTAIAAVAPNALAAGTSAGQLYAFGSNFYGELGSSTDLGSGDSTPAPVSLPGATGPVTLVASGYAYSLAVTSTGQLFSFGLNDRGQLGVATNSGTTNSNPTPMQVSLPGASGPIVRVAAGWNYSLVLTMTGQLYTFGDNDFGENGYAADPNPHPTPTLVTIPGAVGRIVQVAAGSNSSLALTATGQVFGWGDNNFGALGNSTNDNTDTANPPTQLTFPGQSGSVTQIAEGYDFGLASTSSGQLYTWGANSQGQLGFTPNSNPNPTPTLISLPGATGAPAGVYAGDSYSAATTTGGQLYTFGDNDFGEMGNSINSGTSNPNPTPTPVSLPGANGGVATAAAGTNRSLAVTSSGQLYAFGLNFEGELGFTPNFNPNPTPSLVPLPAGATVDAVSTGPWGYHTLAVIADLAVASGSLAGGQVGSAYRATLSATGGIPPYGWTATGLPPGLSLNGADGNVSGTPSTAGTYNPVFTVTDADGIMSSRSLTITIAPPPPPAARVSRQSVVGPTDVFTVSCSGLPGQVCSGSVVATTRVREAGHHVLGVTARNGHRKRSKPRTVTVTIARSSYSIPAGKRAAVRLTLKSYGKRLLAGRLRVPAKASFTGSLNQTLKVTFAYPPVTSPVTDAWTWFCGPNGSCHTTLEKLTISGLPSHSKVVVICRAGGCPLGTGVFRPRGRTLRLGPKFAHSQLLPGGNVQLEIIAPNKLGKVVIFTIQTNTVPKQSTRCFEPGAKAPQRCA